MADVNNQDIAGLHARLNRFLREAHKSASSGLSAITTPDMARFKSYLNAVTVYQTWVVGQPELDLPETHPRVYTLEANPAITDVNNEAVNDFLRMLENTRDELTNAASARRAAGLSGFDSQRLTDNVTKAMSFLVDYVEPITPLDLPETSPDAVSSGSGTTGI